MHIEDTVIEILCDICGTKKVSKDKDANLIELGFLDSMGVVELLTELEDRFGIEIPLDDFDVEAFSTINKIESYLVKLLG